MKNKVSLSVKSFIAICSVLSVIIACFHAIEDGYSHWGKRLLYFTNLSNIWIGLTCLVAVIMLLLKKENSKSYRVLIIIKYVFTVSITITCLVFCCLLAPFAETENYNAWNIASVFAHVIVPVLSVIDFFIEDYQILFTKIHALYSIIPPLLYFIFCMILSSFGVDFGRGETYPYFFMNFKTEAGLFGFVGTTNPPQMGTIYWLALILGLILGLGFLYRYIFNRIKSKKEKD